MVRCGFRHSGLNLFLVRLKPDFAYGNANACRPFDNCTTMYCLPWCM